MRWIYGHIDIAFYVGKNNFDYFRKSGLSARQLIYAPHAIDNDRFANIDDPCKNYANVLRQKLKILPGSLVFLFAGKMELKKDPAILLEAFRLSNFDDSVHLLMVGNGKLDVVLREEYGNISGIHFIDFHNQLLMPAIYEIADAFVLPSMGPGETWGLSVNEAMANGNAVIVSDKCGCAVDLVTNGLNGYIFQAEHVNDLIKALRWVFENKHNLESIKKESKKKISNFTIEKIAESIEVCVNTDLGRKSNFE